MDYPITITAAQLIGFCSAIITLSGAFTLIVKAIKALRAPDENQNARLDEHEKRLDDIDRKFEKHDEFFGRDKARIDAIEEGEKYMQKAMLALLGNAIDGNNKTQMVDARDSLQNWLINR